MKQITALTAFLFLLTASGAFASGTECKNIQLGKPGSEIYVGIKESEASIQPGYKGLVTIVSQPASHWRELTGKTLEVLSMTLLEQGSGSSTYAVKLRFPYDPELAAAFNQGVNRFYTFCTVYR